MASDRSKWSCDEKAGKACRNPFGCHCREITAQVARIAALEAELAEARAALALAKPVYSRRQLEARATTAEARAEKMAEALEPFKTAIEAVPIQGRKFVQVIMTGDEIAKIFAALGRPE